MIAINFATGRYRLIDGLQKGLAAAGLVLAVAALVILGGALSLRGRVAALEVKVKEMAAAEEQFRPLLIERDLITRNLNAMSGLLESRSFSWTGLLSNVETIVPVGVALAKLSYNPRDHALVLDGTAHSPESLRNLMVGLERASAFQEPYLKHQFVDKGSISFNVVTSYRQPKSSGVAAGK